MRLGDLEGLQTLLLPDAWQREAVHALQSGRDVIVDAPTGAGKTHVFERFVEQGNFARRAVFTVPTRALANDKYAEWRARGWRVGITTGDLSVSPHAPVVVATLEAAQGALLRPFCNQIGDKSAPRGDLPDLLVIDEYQWLADPARGNHYEGVLATLPASVQLLLLSGSVANPEDVAAWFTRLGRRVRTVRTAERPVPLEEIEIDDLVTGLPREIEGFWSRRVAGALREGLAPVLVFAPHRADAERLARQFARELPLADPLPLTAEQISLAGPVLAKLLQRRVAFHHSGLSYAQRAGLVEPLAKAGQLRAVVATLGLAAGINFSLRSVMLTAAAYRTGAVERDIAPHELLQMIGRAGRRGLDDTGYMLVSGRTPRLRRAAPLRLKRAAPLPWAALLRRLAPGESALALAADAAPRFFTDVPLLLGAEATSARLAGPDSPALPCSLLTDTGRARLVRRRREPFPGCASCALRPECLALSPEPTPLWEWQRVGVLDKRLRLTARGAIVSAFLGPEGLALAAGLEDRRYPVDQLLYDCANLFAGDRFSGTNPRRLGRLAFVCEKTYRRLVVEGYLDEGLPPAYGYGASEIVQAVVERTASRGALSHTLADEQANAGRGDIDRLLTEWRSFLKSLAAAPALSASLPFAHSELRARWDDARAHAQRLLGDARAGELPDLPPLTPEQTRPVIHQLGRAVAQARIRV
ncbi:MAG: DEAD/DEAH box helicase [Opitutaceae bacterium]|jgi:superfamily II DNA/RNA helicase|nr:DEAD/DEAH box helicase [Opitutaceae bacterium]